MRPILLALTLMGCTTAQSDGLGLLADEQYGLMNPFPSSDLVVDGAITLDEDLLPQTETDLPVERLYWRGGFSPIQPIVIELPGVDSSTFPSWRNPTPGEGSVQLWDLATGEPIPVMAEIDQHPEGTGNTVLIRPQVPMSEGRVAVVITTDAVQRPERFDDLLKRGPYADLADELAELGVDEDSLALAWDFPVQDGRTPLRDALDQLTIPDGLEFDLIRNGDDGDTLPLRTFRQATGEFPAMRVVGEDNLLFLDADGGVTPDGTLPAELFVHIPESVAEADAGTVPVLVVGHGMFGTPQTMYSGEDELGPFVEMADRLGVIVVGTRWRGLDYTDAVVALAASNDFGRFPQVPELMIQGQVNTHTLVARVRDGSIFDDPVFEGRNGQLLPDPDVVAFHGTSMGGVLGGVFMGSDPPIDAAVLRVPGGVWSALLERSSQWTLFESGLVPAIPDPVQRQQMYAVTQLFWDPVDPVNYGQELQSKDILIQESVGDNVVTNMGTRVLARSMDALHVQPVVEAVPGLEVSSEPSLGPGVRAFVQYDTGAEPPPDINRPAPGTGAHSIGYGWDGMLAQTMHFLDPATLGEVVHYCGTDACSPANQGAFPD